jgi:hypothetical protein
MALFGGLAAVVPQSAVPQAEAQSTGAGASACSAGCVPAWTIPNYVEHDAPVANKETWLDAVLYTALKVVIHKLFTDIIAWVQTGFEGNPAFINDPQGFFTDAADQAIGWFFETNFPKLAWVCEPFGDKLRAVLQIIAYRHKDKDICRVSDIIGNFEGAYQQFVQGDFIEVGWGGWYDLTIKDSRNNVYGSLFQLLQEFEIEVAARVNREQDEKQANKYWLTWKTCPKGSTKDKDNGKCYTEFEGERQEVDKQANTPGTLITSQFSDSMQSGLRQLELADEINELAQAVVQYMVEEALRDVFSSKGVVGTGATGRSDPGDISITLNAVPANIEPGGKSQLIWSVSGGVSNPEDELYCESIPGNWHGDQLAGGPLTVTPTVNTTYTLACTSSRGTTVRSATVNVGAGSGIILTATPERVLSGGSFTMEWDAVNVVEDVAGPCRS